MTLSNITIVTACRDVGESGVTDFRMRVEDITWPRTNIKVCIMESDSKDDTWEQLGEWYYDDPHRIRLKTMETGSPKYGQHTSPERFKHLARIWNWALGMADLDWSDYIFLVPFDIIWNSDTITQLWRNNVDLVSPLTFCDDRFYDTWAMERVNGKKWKDFTKDWCEENLKGRLLQMNLIGGTVLIDAKVLKAGCRFTEEDCDHGLVKAARSHKFRCYVDTSCWVEHPREEAKPWSY
jgi:hypothetical protein